LAQSPAHPFTTASVDFALSTLLITGGSGFFGKSLLDAFARGRLTAYGITRVVAVARHASSLELEAPQLVAQGVEVVDADVLRLRTLFDADLVIHAAASADAVRYGADPRSERSIIIEGTRRILDLAHAANRPPNVLYVSSGAVYGHQPSDVIALTESASFRETVDRSKVAYSNAKRTAEVLVQTSAAQHGLKTSIARCFAFIGPWLPRDRHFAIGNFIGNALLGEPIVVKARHEVIRSYLYADDLVDWLVRIALDGSQNCPVYNVGSDEAISIRALAALVGRIGGVPVAPSEPANETGGETTDRYVPDITLARRELGLSVNVRLEMAIESTLGRLTGARHIPKFMWRMTEHGY
jgi:nucleoside-diphosphate-sugar epimerase